MYHFITKYMSYSEIFWKLNILVVLILNNKFCWIFGLSVDRLINASCCERNNSNPLHTRWYWCLSIAQTKGECMGRASTSAHASVLDLNYFLSNKTYVCMTWFIHDRKQNHLLSLWNLNTYIMALKCHCYTWRIHSSY